MSATKSVKANASAFIESKAVDENSPDAIIMALEESFRRGAMVPFTRINHDNLTVPVTKSLLQAISRNLQYESPVNEELLLLRAKRLQRKALSNNFGIYFGRETDGYEAKLITNAKETTVSREDRLAALVAGIQKVHSFREWTEQMEEPQQSKNFNTQTECQYFELPPHRAPQMIMQKKGHHKILKHKIKPELQKKAEKLGWTPISIVKAKWHSGAYYSITLPDGRAANMRKEEGRHRPKLENYPSFGLRMLATRLGFIKPRENYRGGDTKILNMMLGEDKIDWIDPKNPKHEDGTPRVQKVWKWLPAYEATVIDNIWLENVWEIKVGWKPNPKITPSQYWKDVEGELTLNNPNILVGEDGSCFSLQPDDEAFIPALTISELDYETLSDSKDLAIENEDGEVMDYMNEEEEFLTMFPERNTDNHFLDFKQYVAGEGEEDFDDDELKLLKQASYNLERSESGVTMGDLQSQQMIRHLGEEIDEATGDLLIALQMDCPDAVRLSRKKLSKAERFDKGWNEFIGYQPDHAMVRYWYPTKYSILYRSLDFRPEVKEIPGASVMPYGKIDAPIVHHVDSLPPSSPMQFTWLNAISPRLMERREQQNRKAHAIQSANDGTLRAQLAFSRALEEALRA